MSLVANLILGNARVLTCDGPPDAPLGLIERGWVAIAEGTITAIGSGAPAQVPVDAEVVDLEGRLLTPGLIDCHTHAIFAGDRSAEFAMRAAGKSYLDIAAAGGGIAATTAPTRAASDDQLVALTLERIHRAASLGTTTMEIKSGYDLTCTGELRLLRCIMAIAARTPTRIVPTLLCHLVPAERRGDRARYVDELAMRLIPEAATAQLATSVDVYCDDGAFTLDESRQLLTAARRSGLAVRAHAGQFSDRGACELVAELGGLSVDHVEHISPAAIAALAAAGTVAVMLPGACIQLRLPVPPVAALRAAGVSLAIATDLNPGSSFSEHLPLQMWLATTHYGMTVDEAWLGVTVHAASALALPRAGKLAPGFIADLVAWDCAHPAEVPYHYGASLLHRVWIGGSDAK
jgi:imidazolonepropionase